MGARVVAVCRGSAKADALRKLGADAVVDTAEAGKDVPLRQLIKVLHMCILLKIWSSGFKKHYIMGWLAWSRPARKCPCGNKGVASRRLPCPGSRGHNQASV